MTPSFKAPLQPNRHEWSQSERTSQIPLCPQNKKISALHFWFQMEDYGSVRKRPLKTYMRHAVTENGKMVHATQKARNVSYRFHRTKACNVREPSLKPCATHAGSFSARGHRLRSPASPGAFVAERKNEKKRKQKVFHNMLRFWRIKFAQFPKLAVGFSFPSFVNSCIPRVSYGGYSRGFSRRKDSRNTRKIE